MELVSEFNIKEYLGDCNYRFLMDELKKVLEKDEYKISSPLRIIGEQITDRLSMVNLCPIGRVAEENEDVQLNRKRFVDFDSENGYRLSVTAYLEKVLAQLMSEKNLEIVLGGQTSFDIGIRDQDKSNAIRVLLQEAEYDRIVFIGDALFEGGNDSTIRRFIENWPKEKVCPVEAIQTESWENTIDILQNLNFIK
jgi:hydroxymethylpyrimidine pyrophosphatase-like HAD family hydrolase